MGLSDIHEHGRPNAEGRRPSRERNFKLHAIRIICTATKRFLRVRSLTRRRRWPGALILNGVQRIASSLLDKCWARARRNLRENVVDNLRAERVSDPPALDGALGDLPCERRSVQRIGIDSPQPRQINVVLDAVIRGRARRGLISSVLSCLLAGIVETPNTKSIDCDTRSNGQIRNGDSAVPPGHPLHHHDLRANNRSIDRSPANLSILE